ncbi:hypothetical protein NDU88_004892 [Pleurodeles waltl]|uniref:Uncharacterized protein n=1 Tax=Pleurodeles waltl TaxID=8319 RepID=A0AAV7V5Q9_PLEWA|nr:hypothetical protein NDU88_004892 [Pleurodeles waltl]
MKQDQRTKRTSGQRAASRKESRASSNHLAVFARVLLILPPYFRLEWTTSWRGPEPPYFRLDRFLARTGSEPYALVRQKATRGGSVRRFPQTTRSVLASLLPARPLPGADRK